ncbi:MAG: 30S ribosomal protein S9 [Microgenomates group bacterium]|jgi:small subunit ribosomal protein S9|nr:30S ribosomal protein S9 [Candidatus Woesebacteria bacterium]MBP6882881.1 30S ribosomal protein S9 [Candidatus Woesebacteria bacterium]QQR63539.1 MAG: 30S ribosomal protein S9 [Candidatus Roizmanbacteria bacterium]
MATKVKTKSNLYHEAVGRRKSAISRVRLYVPGKEKSMLVEGNKATIGNIFVNAKPIATLFSATNEKIRYLEPLLLTKSDERFIISAHIRGGGRSSQLDALIHSIARALEKVNEEYRPILKKAGLLTRDARVRERRKVGTGGKARRQKQSPKR